MEMLKRLTALRGPSGHEDAVRTAIRQAAEPWVDEIRQDPLGNLILRKKGKVSPAKPVVLAAYMDEPGFMVKEITEEGLIRFGMMSETDRRTILGKRVLVGEAGKPGVIGLKPIHLTTKEERKTLPKMKELYIDIGAENRAACEKWARKGDDGVFGAPMRVLGGRRILAKALGRSVGCMVLLGLMQQELPMDVTLVFTVQRLVGSRGAYGAAVQCAPGCVIVLDLCPGAENGEDSLPQLGKGPVIPTRDRTTIYDRRLRDCLIAGAARAGKPVQRLAEAGVRGDGAAFQRGLCGAATGALYCPAKYTAAPCQMADRADIAAMTEILRASLVEMEAVKPWE